MYEDTKIVKVSDTEYKAVEDDAIWKKRKRAFSFSIKFSGFTIVDTCLVQDLKAIDTDDGLSIEQYDGSYISSQLFATGSILDKDLFFYSNYPEDEGSNSLTLSKLFNSKDQLKCSFFEMDYYSDKKGHYAYVEYDGIGVSLPRKTIDYIIKLLRKNNKIQVTIDFLLHQQYHKEGQHWHIYVPDDSNKIYLSEVEIKTFNESTIIENYQDDLQVNPLQDLNKIALVTQLNYKKILYAIVIGFTILTSGMLLR